MQWLLSIPIEVANYILPFILFSTESSKFKDVWGYFKRDKKRTPYKIMSYRLEYSIWHCYEIVEVHKSGLIDPLLQKLPFRVVINDILPYYIFGRIFTWSCSVVYGYFKRDKFRHPFQIVKYEYITHPHWGPHTYNVIYKDCSTGDIKTYTWPSHRCVQK